MSYQEREKFSFSVTYTDEKSNASIEGKATYWLDDIYSVKQYVNSSPLKINKNKCIISHKIENDIVVNLSEEEAIKLIFEHGKYNEIIGFGRSESGNIRERRKNVRKFSSRTSKRVRRNLRRVQNEAKTNEDCT